MKVAFVADVHVGNHKQHGGKHIAGMNTRGTSVVYALGQAMARAVGEYEVDLMISLGDLFDTVMPTPQALHAVQKAFAYDGRCGVGVLLGNHERVSDVSGDHALGPLSVLSNATVYERSGALCHVDEYAVGKYRREYLCMVPFQPGFATDWLEGEVAGVVDMADDNYECVALCIHLGIRDPSQQEPWMLAAGDAIDAKELADICHRHGIHEVFAGNWHTHQTWEFYYPEDDFKVKITQVGALVPTGWDNPGVEPYGGVSLLGCEDDRFVVPGPRFVEVHDKENLKCVAALHPEHQLYVRAKVPPQHVGAAKHEIREVAEGCENVVAWEVIADQKAAQASARKAAVMARSKSTLRDAVDTYFDYIVDMPVNKDRVRARVAGYLGMKDGAGS